MKKKWLPYMHTQLIRFLLGIISFFLLSHQSQSKNSDPVNRQDSISAGEFHLTMCLFYSDQNKYDSAIVHAENAIAIFTDIKDSLGLIDMYHELSLINLDIGIYDEALAYNERALNISKILGDSSRIIHHYKDNAIIYHDYKKYDKGIEDGNIGYSLSKIFSRVKSSEIADVLNSIAVNYQSKQQFSKALDFHFKSLNAFGDIQKNNIELLTYEDSIKLAKVMNSIGGIYLETKDYQKAKSWLTRALSLNTLLADDFELANNFNNLGTTFSMLKKYDSASYYLNKAQQHAISSGSIENLMDVYASLNIYNRSLGKLNEALIFQDKRLQLQDSVSQLKQNRAHDALEARYQIIKKQQKIDNQNAELKEQEAQLKVNILIIIGLFLTLIIAALIFVFWQYNIRNKQKETLRVQEQKLKEQQTSAVINSLENERKRIARDIHDGLGQSVSALGLNIFSLHKSDSSDASNQTTFENSQVILNNIHDEIRSIAFTLMPHKLMKAGLTEALSELIFRINESKTLSIKLNTFDVPENLNETVKLSLFRVIQELLSNIVKYAKATNVELQLTGYSDELIILIEDDGTGYDINLFKNSKGNGWNNIQYRLNLINAKIDFDTQPERKGSTITIEVPCQ
ncbi:tetratricopeptide repeat protein [Reichenbachiella sp. MALMAid0571]|uniref:tetratricopeptide repeat-containing sensor histidine kinase n=1 Tax=Reichenbachiella sp. MALMAid0571 TaxID=3143939 RepID=UPI0032E051E3